jgi:hypothetical protein
MPLFGMYAICNQVAHTAKRAPYAPTIKMLRQAAEFPETGNSALQGRNFLFFDNLFILQPSYFAATRLRCCSGMPARVGEPSCAFVAAAKPRCATPLLPCVLRIATYSAHVGLAFRPACRAEESV